MKEYFDFHVQMLNKLLKVTANDKIEFSDLTNWKQSHPYYRLNYYDGTNISQVLGIYLLFSKEFLSQFDNIIEIGSYNGGLSSYIFDSKKENCMFVSYDIDADINMITKRRPEIDFRIGDCFKEKYFKEIASYIKRDGKTLLICDGGDKIREFNEFTKYLKPDDIAILHDYNNDNIELWEQSTSYWQWPYGYEASYSDIKDSIDKYSLKSYHNDIFNFYLWGAYKK